MDASVILAALIEDGERALWADGLLRAGGLVAPMMLHAEVTDVLRRLERAGRLPPAHAGLAFAELRAMPLQRVAFEPYADRIWELRHNVSAYDAWYVAAAELHGLPLVTLDIRLASAPGPRCEFLTPPD